MAASKNPSRRDVLGGVGALGACGLVGIGGEPARGQESNKLIGPATRADIEEHARLRDLDLDTKESLARQAKMPAGKIGGITFGRLISGSNLISMNMHARDLGYVNSLAKKYNTEERILMTLKLCEEYGVNGIVLKDHNFRQFRLRRYWNEWGGRMKWLADVITTDIDKYEQLLEEHLELGASAAYLWGGASDIWYHQGKKGNIIKAFEIMKKYNVPVGICAHRLEPIEFCEAEGIQPDFYMKTLHHDKYWSAHPKENRRFIEMFEANSEDHGQYHDNMFCHDHERTVEFMQDVKAPWIAFKVLAAGAIGPKEGLQYAFESGADFVCLGMFDYQVREDIALTLGAIEKAANRKRPWMG
ncbi:MAG: twin-arginine translocation signal domain-containing protein [Sedimentisphaerales bacterium]|nr:twin-arginine translocation signal domain-containing protein [Sedimentisphaerales bacterium]